MPLVLFSSVRGHVDVLTHYRDPARTVLLARGTFMKRTRLTLGQPRTTRWTYNQPQHSVPPQLRRVGFRHLKLQLCPCSTMQRKRIRKLRASRLHGAGGAIKHHTIAQSDTDSKDDSSKESGIVRGVQRTSQAGGAPRYLGAAGVG